MNNSMLLSAYPFIFLLSAGVVGFGFLLDLISGRHGDVGYALYVAFVAVLVALYVWRRASRPLATRVRVEMSEAGVRMVDDDTPEPVWSQLQNIVRVYLSAGDEDRLRIQMLRAGRRFADRVTIDADVLCTAEGRSALIERMRAFRHSHGLPPLDVCRFE